MHIAFAIASLGAGGAERVLSMITATWIAYHQITVISFDRADEKIFHDFDSRIEFVRLGLPSSRVGRLRAVMTSIDRLAAMRRALNKLQPDAVISFLTKINVLVLLASLGTRRRVIISERNNPKMQEKHSAWNALLARLHWRASAIVMQTHGSLECLDGRTRERAFVINNPVEIPPRAIRVDGPPVLAAVGRLTPQKGFDLLIRAFAALAPRHPDWTLRIWGEGEERAALEHQVTTLGLVGRIDLPGNSANPGEWMRGADAFVFSSRYEGFGNALAEAAAAGLAVVSFACPFGPSDIVDHERTGLLVPPGDVDALSAALDRVMGDPALRQRLGDAARDDMARFSLDRVIAQWDAVLSHAVDDAAHLRRA